MARRTTVVTMGTKVPAEQLTLTGSEKIRVEIRVIFPPQATTSEVMDCLEDTAVDAMDKTRTRLREIGAMYP